MYILLPQRVPVMWRSRAETGYLPNSGDFTKELEVSRRTVARDLDFLRDEERTPLAYDDARQGSRRGRAWTWGENPAASDR